jgi:hypothetical protein
MLETHELFRLHARRDDGHDETILVVRCEAPSWVQPRLNQGWLRTWIDEAFGQWQRR